MSFELMSPAFAPEGTIPRTHTCDGQDSSPMLQWSNTPPGVQSFALIADDPDAPAGVWVHWVLYNLPSGTRAVPEDLAREATLPDGSRQGKNGWGRVGYSGPCPPGGTHRYFFKLYALDTTLDLAPGATKEQLEKAMQGHLLAQAELMGTYSRQ